MNLKNPYPASDGLDLYRVNAEASRDDVNLIKSVFPDGKINTIINLFIFSLAHECRTKQYDCTNRNDLITSIQRRCPTSGSASAGPDDNVGRRTNAVRSRSASKANV